MALLQKMMSVIRLGRRRNLINRCRQSAIIRSLKAEGRKLELQWKASTKWVLNLEEQRSFGPTALQGLGTNDQVPTKC